MIETYIDTKTSTLTECNLSMMDEIDEYEIDLYKTLLWVFVKIDEKLDMELIKDELIENVEESMDAHYAGSKIVDGWIELYFYAQNAKKFENIVSIALQKHLIVVYEIGNYKDAKFKHYETILYPDELELLQIQTNHILEDLQDEGDDLNTPREVEHYGFFQTQAQCDRFIENAQKLDYELKDAIKYDEREYAYCAVITKNQAPKYEEIFKSVEELYALVKRDHGIYEGWSTTLAK